MAKETVFFTAIFLSVFSNLQAGPGNPPSCPTATIQSIQNGNWSNASTWNPSRVPTDGDVVRVGAGITVTYDTANVKRLDAVCVEGHLTFRSDISTKLMVGYFLVDDGGHLTIGNVAQPIASGVTAEVVFTDQPINTVFDPEQFTQGLVGKGKIEIHGAPVTPTFVRVNREPKAGDTSLSLEQPVTGWNPGDELVLPDTREMRVDVELKNPISQIEALTLAASGGATLALQGALAHDHLGARDVAGRLDFLPHVGNLTRNVVIRSENPSGTTGHTIFMDRAAVDIRYAQFKNLGRTRTDPLDDVGRTNQSGRYPLHVQNLMGPVTTPANGYQFTLIGNVVMHDTIDHKRKWGLVISNSHYGFVQGNIVYNAQGEGVVTATGSESFNVIERNFVARVGKLGPNAFVVRNDFQNSEGVANDGMYFRGFNNYIRDNVVANAANYGVSFYAIYVGNIHVPNFKGADTAVSGQYTTVNMNATPFLEFTRNEVYGVLSGMTIWWHYLRGDGLPIPANAPMGVVKDFHAWHIKENAYFNYPSTKLLFDGFVVRGNASYAASGSSMSNGWSGGDYLCKDCTIRGADFQGLAFGFVPSADGGGGAQTIEDSVLVNRKNIYMDSMWTSGCRSDGLLSRTVIARNVKFDSLPGLLPINISRALHGDIQFIRFQTVDLIERDDMFVYDYNRQPGNDFQIFYEYQRPDVILPERSDSSCGGYTLNASPVPGLTNAQNWVTYGIAWAGRVSPCQGAACANRLVHPEIRGDAFPASLPPVLSIVSPGPSDKVSGTNVPVTYATFGNIVGAGVSHAQFQLDGGAVMSDADFDGKLTIANVSPGQHTLEAWLVKVDLSEVPNTRVTVSFKTTLNKYPVVNAGFDQSVTLPATLLLSGQATDDGQPNPPAVLTTQWSKTSGPGQIMFSDGTKLDSRVSFSAAGTYVLRLTADDGELQSEDEISVSVMSGASSPHPSEDGISIGPNPWRGTVHHGQPITITGLPPGAPVKIISRDGRVVNSANANNAGVAIWDLTNKSGDLVVAGQYAIRIDQKKPRKVVVMP